MHQMVGVNANSDKMRHYGDYLQDCAACYLCLHNRCEKNQKISFISLVHHYHCLANAARSPPSLFRAKDARKLCTKFNDRRNLRLIWVLGTGGSKLPTCTKFGRHVYHVQMNKKVSWRFTLNLTGSW